MIYEPVPHVKYINVCGRVTNKQQNKQLRDLVITISELPVLAHLAHF